MQIVVAIPGAGVRAVKAHGDSGTWAFDVTKLRELLDGTPMRCITPYSRSHAIYLWINEEAREELMTRNFEVNQQWANNALYGTVVFTSWDDKKQEPTPLTDDQAQFVLDKLAH